MILDDTLKILKNRYSKQLENLIITNVVVGIHLTAVKLSDNSFGVASTVDDTEVFCLKKDRDYGDFTPSKIKGKKVIDLLESSKQSNIINTLKIAVINAISSKILSNSNYKILQNTDPVNLLNLDGGKTVTIVGAFQSYINKIAATNNKLHVLELNENALVEGQKQYYVPAIEFKRIIPKSNIVIITGLTLVNNTIDGLLEVISPETEVIVTGPSSSLIPDILFKNNIKYIGAVQLTDCDKLFEVVSEGGKGYHLFKYCAQKICIVNE